jgi:hypothetical protein
MEPRQKLKGNLEGNCAMQADISSRLNPTHNPPIWVKDTSLDIFGLEGQLPESNVKGETVDISTIAEYAWYEWVKFRDTAAKFPVSEIQLGRDLGAAIDIGPAMARKILKKNGSVMYRTSVRSLTTDEIQSPTEKKEREELYISIVKKFGASMDKKDFKDDPDYANFVTPTYD